MIPTWDLAVLFLGAEEDAPAVLRHLDVAEVGPAFAANVDGCAEVDVFLLEPFRAHLAPPVLEAGLPVLKRSLEAAVVGKVDVVWNPLGIVDVCHECLRGSGGHTVPGTV